MASTTFARDKGLDTCRTGRAIREVTVALGSVRPRISPGIPEMESSKLGVDTLQDIGVT